MLYAHANTRWVDLSRVYFKYPLISTAVGAHMIISYIILYASLKSFYSDVPNRPIFAEYVLLFYRSRETI